MNWRAMQIGAAIGGATLVFLHNHTTMVTHDPMSDGKHATTLEQRAITMPSSSDLRIYDASAIVDEAALPTITHFSR